MKLELYYHYLQYDWDDEGRIEVQTFDMTTHDKDRILLKVIEVDVPDVIAPIRELVAKHKIAKLKEEKDALQAETQIKLNNIEDKIRQLSALEYRE